ncbi:hypothetical protein MesoLj113c_45170 [Mesorhizobium sp. 113-3-9]|uniref:DUF768 domain-containing protein n=1 Tax=Mesorhizobium sp. 113-3-9 TaxID=2744517 RepID=UPI001927A464|nr:DUF768 domain-containing protein [Mesorhizobium sp. 113-3-9]BCG88407.1 hypothetical protein MesoLj113c_45170 [Mesorhizobium sp. 113-3-9]
MSKRGRDFLRNWMNENVPDHPSFDPALVTDLADRAMEDAVLVGIEYREIDEEVHSLFALMVEAVANQKNGPR